MSKKSEDPKVAKLMKEAEEAKVTERSAWGEDGEEKKKRERLCSRFPVIRSSRSKFSDFKSIRRRMHDAGKLNGSWRGGTGEFEVSTEDLKARGCHRFGRNYVLAELGMGVHEVAYPNEKDKNGRPLSPETRRENRRKGSGIVGFNANGSMTAKALAASKCLKLGIRCQLSVGCILVVDNWKDHEECHKRLHDAGCGFSWS